LILIAIVIAVIAIALIGLIVYLLRSVGQSAEKSLDDRAAAREPSRPIPPVESFHVRGDTASVVFAVPLGDSEAGTHLTQLLAANAVEYVRQRVADGHPLEDVHRIDVSAMRGDTPEHLTTIDLPSAGELPDEAPILRRDTTINDPIAVLQTVTADRSVAPPARDDDHLEPVSEIVELSTPTEAHLRAAGIDTSSMSLEELVLGLMKIGGYHVGDRRPGFSLPMVDDSDIHWVTRGAESSVLAIIEHVDGSYPELDEQILAAFAAAVAQSNPRRAMLVTDKFGPYAMYERERRDKRLVFVTRERLQGFVDSFGLQ
jgi:hypothetical protein